MRYVFLGRTGLDRVVLLFIGTVLLCLGSGAVKSDAPLSTRASAIVLHLDGAVGPATADYVTRGLRTAADRKAQLVILRMDTPGGLDSSMRTIIRGILGSPVPVVTYVSPSGARAASAGTFILYASHVAAMAPGTNTGAATPVQIGVASPPGDDEAKKAPSAMEAKAVNDAVAFIRSLAELRGRNVEWAEKAVREAASISASAAVRERVVDIEARDMNDLLRQLQGRVVKVGVRHVTIDSAALTLVQMEPDWRTRMLATITDPNVALMLMMIGIYGLLFEFMNPGSFLPGTLGTICLLTGLYAFAALPVSYAGLALLLVGIGMMIAEAFLYSHGILGVGGVVAFALGASMLVDVETPEFRISQSLIAGFAVGSALLVLLIVRTAWSARRKSIVSGAEEMIGARGVVQDWREGKGHVFVHGERWSASGEQDLGQDQAVRVVALSGLTVKVERDETKEY